MSASERASRDAIAGAGALLYARGLAHGSAGNLSVRLDDGAILVTPTDSSLGRLDPDRLAKVSPAGDHLSGDPPSKEAFFHLALYAARPAARAVVHLHSTYCVALSCLCHENPRDVLAPLTAYQVMRVGRLPLLRYFRPGDRRLAEAVREAAGRDRAMLLANHGPIVSGRTLDEALCAYEELEEAARIHFILGERHASPLTPEAVADLRLHFPD